MHFYPSCYKFITETNRFDKILLQQISKLFQENQSKHKGEVKLLKWLDEHVITDQVYNIIEVVAWEALWDQAKKLRKREIDDLESQYKNQPVS